jgi:hypothetical protein
MKKMGKVCEKIRQGLPVEAGTLYAVTVICCVCGNKFYRETKETK